MYEKQHHLNRVYYGPNSAHSLKPYDRVGRGGKIILTILIIVGIVVFILWLIVCPNVGKFQVTDASLTEFNYSTTGNKTLNHDLVLKINIHNPNKWINIYYNYIEARALYQGARFDTYSFEGFYQEPKTTNVLRHVFKGQHVVALSAKQTKLLNKEKRMGVYRIGLKMYLKVRFKLGMYKTKTLKRKVSCHLHVPLIKSVGAGSNFEVTQCHWNL